MTLGEIIATLRANRLAVAGVILASMAAAVLAGYRIDGFPPHLIAKTLPAGIASKQLMLDGDQTAVTSLKPDMGTTTGRTGHISELLSSTVVLDEIARRMHIPFSEITAEGPWNGPVSIYNVVVPSEARGQQVLAETKPYRIAVMARVDVPIVTLYTQGPSPEEAARLADTAATALTTYIAGLRAQLVVQPQHPLVVRDLGPASSGSVHGGIGKAVIVLAGFATFTIGMLGVLGVAVLRRRSTGPAPAMS